MSELVKTPNVAKSTQEANERLKKLKDQKIFENTKSAKQKRGY